MMNDNAEFLNYALVISVHCEAVSHEKGEFISKIPHVRGRINRDNIVLDRWEKALLFYDVNDLGEVIDVLIREKIDYTIGIIRESKISALIYY